MSAILLSEIPNQINTVERLSAWSGLLLATLNPTNAVLEAPNRAEYMAQYSIIKAADGTERLILRQSLDLDPAWRADLSKKLWMWTRDISGVVVPAGYKSN